MKAFVKVFVILAGLALIGLSVAALLMFTQFDALAKAPLERALSYAFDTPTTIDSLAFDPAQGALEFNGFTVSNPKGFKAVPAMKFETVSLEFDYQTLFSSTPTVRKLLVRNGVIDFRYDLGEGSNLSRLAHRAARFSKDKLLLFGNDRPPKDDTTKNDNLVEPSWLGGLHRKFIVQEFRCEGITLTAGTSLLPGSTVKLKLEPFTLSEFGKDRPVTTGELAAIFLKSLTREALTNKGVWGPVADTLRKELGDSPGEVELAP